MLFMFTPKQIPDMSKSWQFNGSHATDEHSTKGVLVDYKHANLAKYSIAEQLVVMESYDAPQIDTK